MKFGCWSCMPCYVCRVINEKLPPLPKETLRKSLKEYKL